MGKLYRQGDVLLEECALPKDLKKAKNNLLVEGEATNHAHYAEDCEVLTDESGNLFLDSTKELSDIAIKHLLMDSKQWTGEHTDVKLPPGTYKVTIQRCYNPFEKAIESVKD
jgi:hypothetical protein